MALVFSQEEKKKKTTRVAKDFGPPRARAGGSYMSAYAST